MIYIDSETFWLYKFLKLLFIVVKTVVRVWIKSAVWVVVTFAWAMKYLVKNMKFTFVAYLLVMGLIVFIVAASNSGMYNQWIANSANEPIAFGKVLNVIGDDNFLHLISDGMNAVVANQTILPIAVIVTVVFMPILIAGMALLVLPAVFWKVFAVSVAADLIIKLVAKKRSAGNVGEYNREYNTSCEMAYDQEYYNMQ